MATLFYDESMTITYMAKDQREGLICPPVDPTVVKVSQDNVRPRGADIIDLVQDGDTITITANGNGTGTVVVVAYQEKAADPVTGINLDERGAQGCFETSGLGSKSLINTFSPVATEEVTVLAPPLVTTLDQEIEGPEIDCEVVADPDDEVDDGDTLEIDDDDLVPIACNTGMDVVFVLDDTGSMTPTITALKSQVTGYVDHIKTVSNDNYRIGLITFKDDLSLKVSMTSNNETEFIAELDSVLASGGGDAAEAHVEATQAAIDGTAGAWRTGGIANIVITITDNVPSAGDTAAITTANSALALGIKISGILVPNGPDFVGAAEPSLKSYASVTGGGFIKSSSSRVEDAIVDGALTVCE